MDPISICHPVALYGFISILLRAISKVATLHPSIEITEVAIPIPYPGGCA